MFSIISTMFLGIGIGYVLRNWTILQKTEKTISLTIFLVSSVNKQSFLPYRVYWEA